MFAKPNTVAAIWRQIIAIERQISELAKISTPDKALRLGRASDLLTRRAPASSIGCGDHEELS